MKRFLCLIGFVILGVVSMMAQKADDLVGNYLIDYNGKQSKVKFYKYQNGYRGQTYWVRELKDANGKVKTDVKNPNKALRNVPVDKMVIIDKVVFNDGVWEGGHIYDPTSGKSYKTDIRFKDSKTLEIRGKLGPFFKRIYWTRIK